MTNKGSFYKPLKLHPRVLQVYRYTAVSCCCTRVQYRPLNKPPDTVR